MQKKDLVGSFKAIVTLDSEFVLDNRDALRETIMQQVREQGGDPYEENNCIYVRGASQYFKLPILPRVREGVVEFRSKDFIFRWTDSYGVAHESYCDMPKAADMTISGFTTKNIKREVTTWLLTREG